MHRIINYGSFLQALALRQMIESLGHDVSFVDYHIAPSIHHRNDWPYALRHRLKQLKLRVRYTPAVYRLWDRLGRNVTDERESRFFACYPMLGLHPRKYRYRSRVDALFIGSDEVFNCLQSGPRVGFSMELFGAHHRAKVLASYAASFGNTTLERLRSHGAADIVGRHLKAFDALSVRDENSCQIVRALTGKTPECHMDPVLVGDVEKMRWKPCHEKGYVAVYGYAGRFTAEEQRAIQTFAHGKGLKTIALCDPQDFCDESRICRPDEIIPYIRNADYVVTDTFHGTIFASICHVPMAVFCRKASDAQEEATNEEKLLDVLAKLGLTNRLVPEAGKLEQVIVQPVDFDSMEAVRARERERTMAYLKKCIDLAGAGDGTKGALKA